VNWGWRNWGCKPGLRPLFGSTRGKGLVDGVLRQ